MGSISSSASTTMSPRRVAGVVAPIRRRALVVEDDATNQRVAIKMLEKLGWRVAPADAGRTASSFADVLRHS
jgi:hypothetical protein